MTIKELLAATGLTANDLMPIWDAEAASNVEPTQKITAQQLAAAVKSLAGLPSTTEMNSAIATSQRVVAVGDLITNRSAYFDYHYARKSGKLVIIGFIVKAGVTNETVLCTIDDSIKPETNDYIAPLIYGNGKVNTKGTVWIEARNTSQIKYYGDTIPTGEGSYATLVYMVQ